ncbi:MAG TPA: type I-U CRISPR-associated RAMP protein Csb1/Cas7u [Bryobacteraceae bacterium]|nr:type I-U CRISPR-associated RAMP protein Csb1/Cas7u [Bryobacteraceae bacterium]
MSETKVAVDKFDSLLTDAGPAAIVFRRKLMPVEGKDSWIFPPTFAQSESADEDEEGGGGTYQIDPLPNDERRNVCLIDSIGSQANRIEPLFKKEPYSALVPQVRVKLKDGDEVNLLDAGHRAADAVVRFSRSYGPRFWDAFSKYRKHRDCSDLVKLAPTSLLFGVWDSRGTGVKIQRIVRSVVRGYDVTPAKRRATYRAPYEYTSNGVIAQALDNGKGKNNPLSEQGFKYSLAPETHGGVLVKGDICQEAVINLVALRSLSNDRPTQRYLLGLALVALSYRDQEGFNLREGCLLCAASTEDFDGKWTVVKFDSTKDETALKGFTHELALAFAQSTAKDVPIDQPSPDTFDSDTAEAWLKLKKEKRKVLAKSKHPARAIADETAKAPKEKHQQADSVAADQTETK